MSPRSPPLTVADVRAGYAVRSDTPLGSRVTGAGVTSELRTTRRSPTPAQVTVTTRDPEEVVGTPDGSAADAMTVGGSEAGEVSDVKAGAAEAWPTGNATDVSRHASPIAQTVGTTTRRFIKIRSQPKDAAYLGHLRS